MVNAETRATFRQNLHIESVHCRRVSTGLGVSIPGCIFQRHHFLRPSMGNPHPAQFPTTGKTFGAPGVGARVFSGKRGQGSLSQPLTPAGILPVTLGEVPGLGRYPESHQ